MTCDVLVIGAGVSGLATAEALLARGCDVQVVERQADVGGNATSQQFDGFLMEHGPTTLNAAFPKAMTRIEGLGLAQSRVNLGPNVRKRILRDGDALHGISTRRLGFFLSSYLSPGARLSLLGEILRPRRAGGGEETIHAFVSRRFGTEFADKVIEPMAAGIFMGDAKELSISGSFPKLAQMEQRYGSVLRGMLAAKRGSEPGRQLFSWPQGIATLPRAMASRLSGRVRTGVTVTRVTRKGGLFQVATAGHGTLSARRLVLAVQPHVAAQLLEKLDPQTAAALGAIAAPPIAVAFLGYRKAQVAHPMDGLGFLSTKGAGQVISGAQFSSTMFEGRAPAGHVSLSCYVGGARDPQAAEMAAPALSAAVHQELSGLLGITGQPVVSRTRHWPRGLPHYTLGHSARRATIDDTHKRVAGLYLTGNYLNGVSVTNCLENADKTASLVMGESPGSSLREAQDLADIHAAAG